MSVCRSRRVWLRIARLTVVALVAAGLIASVSSAKPAKAPPAKASNQTLVVRELVSGGVPPVLDPALLTNDNNWTLVDNLFAKLVTVDNKGQLHPSLATSWSSKNNKVWTFNLRHDAKFSDGKPITAADVKYSFVRDLTPLTTTQMQQLEATTNFPEGFVLLPDVLGASDVQNGKATAIPSNAITTPSKYSVRITLASPRTDLPSRLASASMGIVEASNVATSTAGNPWWYHPVSSGPFKVTNFVANTSISLAPNPGWFGTKPILQDVEFKVVSDTQTAEIAYEAGSLDVVKTTYSDITGLETHGYKDQLRSVLDPQVSVFIVNWNNPPTDDVHVVRALAMAIDKRTLTTNVLDNLVTPASTFTPPLFPGYTSKGFTNPLKFSADAAKAELAKSKYGSNITIRAWTSSSQDPRAIQAVAQMWQQNLGIKVQIQTSLSAASAPKDSAANVIFSAQGPNFVTPCSMVQRWPDFVSFAQGANNVNFGAVNPPNLASLMSACYAASASDAWSKAMAVENLMTQYPQFIPVNYNRSYYLTKPYVKGITFGGYWNISDLSNVWIAQH